MTATLRPMMSASIRPMIRLYVDEPLAAGMVVSVAPDQAHYLGGVMRCSQGDAVLLFNGRDGEWTARIAFLKRDRADLLAETRLRPQVPCPDIWLVFALLKRGATDLLVQKATELGVAALRPVITARTTAERLNPARLLRIAREAAEQSERLDIPDLAEPIGLAGLLAGWPAGRRLHAAMERSTAPSLKPKAGPAALLIGPEGGFTPAELDALRAYPFVVPASLGPLILRAETAAIAGLALLQAPI